MTDVPIPATKQLRDLLGDLYGREVEVSPLDDASAKLDPRATVASYHDDARNTVAVVTTDFPLSVNLAAGLALANREIAAEVAAGDSLPDDYAESVREVLSIVGTLFNSPARAVRFHDMHAPGTPVPPRVASFATATGRRLDVKVAVNGYGSGTMSVVV
jgi:hypothetical protein